MALRSSWERSLKLNLLLSVPVKAGVAKVNGRGWISFPRDPRRL